MRSRTACPVISFASFPTKARSRRSWISMVEDNAHAKALGAVFWCFLSEKLGIRFHRFSPSRQFAIQGGAGILSWLQIEGPSKTSARRIQARTDRLVGKPRVLCQIRAPGCVHRSSFRLSYSLSLLTCFFIWSSMVFGQVALDSATSIGQQVSGATPSITLPHSTTAAGTNRVLVVGVPSTLPITPAPK